VGCLLEDRLDCESRSGAAVVAEHLVNESCILKQSVESARLHDFAMEVKEREKTNGVNGFAFLRGGGCRASRQRRPRMVRLEVGGFISQFRALNDEGAANRPVLTLSSGSFLLPCTLTSSSPLSGKICQVSKGCGATDGSKDQPSSSSALVSSSIETSCSASKGAAERERDGQQ
jgi:hypothetical protein